MIHQYKSAPPTPYQSALAPWQNAPRALYTVIDTSDDDTVVATFRNRALAERHGNTSPTYRVREYLIGG